MTVTTTNTAVNNSSNIATNTAKTKVLIRIAIPSLCC